MVLLSQNPVYFAFDNLIHVKIQVPTIGALFSGGGIRAMMSTSAAVKSMELQGLSDLLTYMFGLSGSSWYLTYLYTHDDFGTDPMVYAKLHQQLKASAICSRMKYYLPCALIGIFACFYLCMMLPLLGYLLLAIITATKKQITVPKQFAQVIAEIIKELKGQTPLIVLYEKMLARKLLGAERGNVKLSQQQCMFSNVAHAVVYF